MGNTGDNMTGNSADGITGGTTSDYTASRTSTDMTGSTNSAMTVWIVLIIAGLAIIALAWYYGYQTTDRNNY